MNTLLRLGLAAVFAGLLTLLWLAPFGQRFERDYGLRALYLLRGAVETPQDALIIALERASVDWLRFHARDLGRVAPELDGCLPPGALTRTELARARNTNDLPRGLYACLVDLLARRGAALIVFDVLFNRETEEDAFFAASLARSGRVLLFERIGQPETLAAHGLTERQHPRPIFAAVARGTGFFLVNAPLNTFLEGYVTRLAEFPELPSLARLAHAETSRTRPQVPADPPETQPIWLYGPPGTIPYRTLRQSFERGAPRPLPARLDGRVVFIGLSTPETPGTRDHFPVPIAGLRTQEMAGVELMASAFLNLRRDEVMHRPPPSTAALLVFLLGLAAFGPPLLLGGRAGLFGGAAALALYGGGVAALFAAEQIWLPYAVPVAIGGVGSLLAAVSARYAFAKRLIGRLAPRQVAPRILAGWVAERTRVRIEPATVVFVDIVGSTGLGDRLSPEAYSELLTRYYDIAVDAIDAEGGLAVEFTGDGIVALFPRSVSGPDHAPRAVAAVRAICAGIDAMGAPGRPEDHVPLRLRFGLASGETATGDVGARTRYNYKAIGDTVTIAARLERYGKDEPDQSRHVILLTGTTAEALNLEAGCLDRRGDIKFQGKAESIAVYRLNP
ncbi:MAG: CHASE2 domain-containing protein [Paracoccaceae bacterium]